MIIRRTFAILVFSLAGALAAENMSMVRDEAPLSPVDSLVCEHPAQLHYDLAQDAADSFRAAIRFVALSQDGTTNLNFKLFAGKFVAEKPKDQQELDLAVQKMSAAFVAVSVEKTNEVHHFKERNGTGAYCQFTDASLLTVTRLQPDQFRYVTLGLIKIDDYLFTVQGFSNSRDGDYPAMIAVLEGLKVETKPAAGK